MRQRPELERLFGLRLDEKLHQALKIMAAEKSTTMSAIIRRALREYADVHETIKTKGE